MKITQIHILYITAIILALVLFFKNCDSKTKTVTKIETKTVVKYDTIKTIEIKEVPKIVYVNRYVNIKGEKEIVYVEKPTDSTTIKANQYDTKLLSNNAEAKLKITTTGELLDVQGVINYPETTITKTVTKTKAKSGLFIYALAPINENQVNVEVGAIIQFKNSILLMGGLQHNQFTKSADIKVGIGIKLF